jgi:branched-chain amino acid transport system permease protein
LTGVVQNAIDAMALGSLFALVALGIGLIFGIMRLINFAHGDFIMLGAYALIVPSSAVTATLLIGAWPTPLLVGAICLFVILIALATERLAFRPLRTAAPSVLLITSFALSFFFLRRTPMGVAMRAASEDFRMARLLGVRANRVIAAAFAISGFLAAVVSLLYVAQTGVLAYHMGIPLVLFAFVATVVGGMGSLTGAVLGGFIVGTASVCFQVVLPIDWRPNRDVWVYGMVLLILLLRPAGLIKVRSVEERV